MILPQVKNFCYICWSFLSFLSLITCLWYLPIVLMDVHVFLIIWRPLHLSLPTAFSMTKKMKLTWIPWSDVCSYIPETWNIWWKKGHSCTRQRGTGLTGLISCCSQGKEVLPRTWSSRLRRHAQPLRLKAKAYLSNIGFLCIYIGFWSLSHILQQIVVFKNARIPTFTGTALDTLEQFNMYRTCIYSGC